MPTIIDAGDDDKQDRENPAKLPYKGDIIDERKGRVHGSIDTGGKIDDREAYESNLEEWRRKRKKARERGELGDQEE